jgi:hypothetical protein
MNALTLTTAGRPASLVRLPAGTTGKIVVAA